MRLESVASLVQVKKGRMGVDVSGDDDEEDDDDDGVENTLAHGEGYDKIDRHLGEGGHFHVELSKRLRPQWPGVRGRRWRSAAPTGEQRARPGKEGSAANSKTVQS